MLMLMLVVGKVKNQNRYFTKMLAITFEASKIRIKKTVKNITTNLIKIYNVQFLH